MPAMKLVDTVQDVLREATATRGIQLQGAPLVVGVSGGPDSFALLHALQQLRPHSQIVVAHLDHALRPGSGQDVEVVAAAAAGSRFYSERVDVAAVARERRLSVEEAGRQHRYSFLARVAEEEGAVAVAVGHNADDQAETVLMNLLRGSGLAGLSAMKPVDRLPGHPTLWLLRPLLRVSRVEIERYCAENGLHPIMDTSNTDRAFLRNRIRHELLPALEAYSPNIRQRLGDTADVLSAEDELLADTTDSAWQQVLTRQEEKSISLDRAKWQGLPLALRRRVLRKAAAIVGAGLNNIGYKTIESARQVAESGDTGSLATLPKGIELLVSYGIIIISKGAESLAYAHPQLEAYSPRHLPVQGEIDLDGGWRLTAEIVAEIDLGRIRANADPWVVYVAVATGDRLIVRNRMPGERIRPLGLGGEKKIKEVMIDRKIPQGARRRWPIVAASDHPIWIVGHMIDDRARVDESAGLIVRLRCLPAAQHETC